MPTSPLAGTPPSEDELIDVAQLVRAYYAGAPDPAEPGQRVAFGTSGHRGSALRCSFNEAHILAITQAICDYRAREGTTGPLFLGIDTHALSAPAQDTAVEVLAASGVDVMLDAAGGYTPTPVVSHAIVTHNRGRTSGLADGIVVTPSHNPPEDGGFKYNPPHGGPADTATTRWIEERANALLADGLSGVRRLAAARSAPTTHRFDYVAHYVDDLPAVLDLEAVRGAGVRIGVDPMGGAAVAYWPRVAERHGLDLTVVNDRVDPTFRFMPRDWDGRIRMDCSSPHAMANLIALRDRFDVAFGNDADCDRHGIVTPTAGLLNPNHYLAVAVAYLFETRRGWRPDAAVGKTVVTSALVDRVAARLGRRLFEVPVGFKWFAAGLGDGTLGFGGEESAGASFLRRDGTAWVTDKDGLALGLLAAEIRACTGEDPGARYAALARELGTPLYARIDAPATARQKAVLASLAAGALGAATLAGDPVVEVRTTAPGNGAAIGGLKVSTAAGWFAARPSGTEEVYKIYAESFRDGAHLARIQHEAQALVAAAFRAAGA